MEQRRSAENKNDFFSHQTFVLIIYSEILGMKKTLVSLHEWFSKCGVRRRSAEKQQQQKTAMATAFECVNGGWLSAFMKRH